MANVKWWADKVVWCALGMASWCLLEVVALKIRTNRTEDHITAAVMAQQAIRDELLVVEKEGTFGLKVHKQTDDERDMDKGARLTRLETTNDKTTALLIEAASDIKWIKVEIERLSLSVNGGNGRAHPALPPSLPYKP